MLARPLARSLARSLARHLARHFAPPADHLRFWPQTLSKDMGACRQRQLDPLYVFECDSTFLSPTQSFCLQVVIGPSSKLLSPTLRFCLQVVIGQVPLLSRQCKYSLNSLALHSARHSALHLARHFLPPVEPLAPIIQAYYDRRQAVNMQ